MKRHLPSLDICLNRIWLCAFSVNMPWFISFIFCSKHCENNICIVTLLADPHVATRAAPLLILWSVTYQDRTLYQLSERCGCWRTIHFGFALATKRI